MLRVLAIDLAKNRTGWAVGSPEGRPLWGVYETHAWGKSTCGAELGRWRDWLGTMRDEHEFTAVAIEQVFVDANPKHFNFGGTQAQMMISGVLFEWCHANEIPAYEIAIDAWRKHFLGFNRRPKDAGTKSDYWKVLAMKVAAQRNCFVEHHDSAEALGILDYTLSTLDQGYRHRTMPTRGRQDADIMFKRGPIHG